MNTPPFSGAIPPHDNDAVVIFVVYLHGSNSFFFFFFFSILVTKLGERRKLSWRKRDMNKEQKPQST